MTKLNFKEAVNSACNDYDTFQIGEPYDIEEDNDGLPTTTYTYVDITEPYKDYKITLHLRAYYNTNYDEYEYEINMYEDQWESLDKHFWIYLTFHLLEERLK